jgi:hypothetical protein
MNILHESCLIASAPAAVLVGLAIFSCVCAVILLALSIEAGNYPELVGWFTRLHVEDAETHGERGPESRSQLWFAIAGGYQYDRAP